MFLDLDLHRPDPGTLFVHFEGLYCRYPCVFLSFLELDVDDIKQVITGQVLKGCNRIFIRRSVYTDPA